MKKIKKDDKYNFDEKEFEEMLRLFQLASYEKTKFRNVLPITKLDDIRDPEIEGMIKASSISEKEWLRFYEIFTYNTNLIEGASITQEQVIEILRRDRWPEGVEGWEIHETYGVADALQYVRDTRSHFSLKLMRDLHQIVFWESKSFAGKFRSKGIEVVVSNSMGIVLHRSAPSEQVVPLLKEMKQWYKGNKKKYNPLVLAAVMHNQFENIHPFQDGNGRVGRLLLNNLLLKHDMAPVNIEYVRRAEYYSALGQYQNYGEVQPMIELIQKEYKNLEKEIGR